MQDLRGRMLTYAISENESSGHTYTKSHKQSEKDGVAHFELHGE